MCPSNNGSEDKVHNLLLCPSFTMNRRELVTSVLALVQPFECISLSNKDSTHILFYGGKDLITS